MAILPTALLEALTKHWPEFLIESALLAMFMIAACVVVAILQHPRSPVAGAIKSPVQRRAVIGVLMGLTAVAIIYSPWGQRSGAHLNPGTTLTFLLLGKVQPWVAAFYIAAQFLGGFLGVRLAALAIGELIGHDKVRYAATVPGRHGVAAAWIAEFMLAFGMMTMVLWSTNNNGSAPYTGILAGVLIAVYIVIEAPISGMSMNPARTLGSAIPARAFGGLWVYFTAPPLAMLAAAGLYVSIVGTERVFCAKMNHSGGGECIFNCRIEHMPGRAMNPSNPTGIQDKHERPSPATRDR